MASRREIAITIKGNVGGGGGGKEIGYSAKGPAIDDAYSSDEVANKELKNYNDGSGKSGSKAAAFAITLYALNEVKNSIVKTASQGWNRHIDMKEDYLASNNMNEIKAKIGAVKSYASAAITGAKIGSIGGPIGIAIGAAVGTVANAGNRVINYALAQTRYNEQNNAMNAQTNFSRVRMGLMDGGRGTEN